MIESLEISDSILDNSVTLLSFNEELLIKFNEEKHIYSYSRDKLIGGTTHLKKYLQDFDSSQMTTTCEKSWQVSREKIEAAWELSKDVSVLFGTSIHKALEFEHLYRSHCKPKDKSRCFVLKHPVINNIVQDFFTFYDTLGFTGQVISEALVTDVENLRCGLIDRLLITSRENKTCRLQDYKVNHTFNTPNVEKFNSLVPKQLNFTGTKLNKLSLQLKYYAQMLEKSGWTVEGFDAFVFEDKWIHYEADRLQGFDVITGVYTK